MTEFFHKRNNDTHDNIWSDVFPKVLEIFMRNMFWEVNENWLTISNLTVVKNPSWIQMTRQHSEHYEKLPSSRRRQPEEDTNTTDPPRDVSWFLIVLHWAAHHKSFLLMIFEDRRWKAEGAFNWNQKIVSSNGSVELMSSWNLSNEIRRESVIVIFEWKLPLSFNICLLTLHLSSHACMLTHTRTLYIL